MNTNIKKVDALIKSILQDQLQEVKAKNIEAFNKLAAIENELQEYRFYLTEGKIYSQTLVDGWKEVSYNEKIGAYEHKSKTDIKHLDGGKD